MKFPAVLTLLLLSACSPPPQTEHDVLSEARCTVEQFARVEHETRVCSATSYLTSFCFRTALQRICTMPPKL